MQSSTPSSTAAPPEIGSELDKGAIPFEAEGRLLQELGLRLVAKPEVALVELIKNAYDADSPTCTVRLEKKQTALVIADEGNGMTIGDFKTKWMRIATGNKLAGNKSPGYGRALTGAKGIGRFAVRYLGDKLTLESVAFDKHYSFKTRLTAVFDWPAIDAAGDIKDTAVEYSLIRVAEEVPVGTILTIEKLRSTTDFAHSSELRDEVLRIVTPLQALASGDFGTANTSSGDDPGFRVILPGDLPSSDVDLAKKVLDNYWGRLTVELSRDHLKMQVWLPTLAKPRNLNLRFKTSISRGFFADIRYFPRRKGIFQSKGFNGQKAWQWVRSNCGVKVVDHGFHLRPYGFENDDWLQVDRDKAHSKREWETDIAKKHFPVTAAEKADPKANPVLNLPYEFQLVGAVFIETRRNLGSRDESDLLPAMDREGLLENNAFRDLRNCVRAGLEFLAHEDKDELNRIAEEKAKEEARSARSDLRKAIKYIERSVTLTSSDKSRIIKQYQSFADRLQKHEEYSAQARRGLMTMSLLGVVAGFMTHESKAIVHELEQAMAQISMLAKKHPELAKVVNDLSERLEHFQGYLNYARMFVRNVRTPQEQPLSAAGQVRFVLKQFENFAKERGISVSNDIAASVSTPPLPVTVYSGVLLNLYTNALKAVTSAQSSIDEPRITFRAWNERKKHIVEVADNGPGIPPDLRDRIWDPLYTTTSDIGNPLGSGMGLGLTLIKQVVAEFGGKVSLTPEPPPGFSTCFRVIFPFG